MKKEINQFLTENHNKKVLLVFDWSGSCSIENSVFPSKRPLYLSILNDVKGSISTQVIFVDHTIKHVTSTDNFSFPSDTGGGTDFCIAFDWAKEKGYEAVIFVTEGVGEAPSVQPLPTLWLLDDSSKNVNLPIMKGHTGFGVFGTPLNWGKRVVISS